MVSLRSVLLSTLGMLVTSASAGSGCRCGSSDFLTFPRVNLTTEQVMPCAAYKLIDARGTGEPQGVSMMFQTSIQRALANSTAALSHSVIYPAGYDQNVTAGVKNILNVIQYGVQECPGQKYFLFGYSQGATVILEALSQLDEPSAAAVASVVVVGNPYRLPGKLSNVDSIGRPDNRTALGLFAVQAQQSNATAPVFSDALDRSGKVADICLENDIVCAFDPQCTCQLASDHLSYGLMQSVQDVIFEHVVSRF
ncbi:family 5 carbohydrate esterase [Colletotrichum truncatum]|uniref:Family 5 carbohydrate esterase n=1 Tax=Colletotrichum truncatum TaxID=5467 RepID=A0ACC3YYY1_COLTU|nr:family 5 carbohydrate esterase [Colletotrichum truncatum]KAF6781105.1 family 5 carbohydrate esterase [Colletotrichum truncatum]